MLAEQQLKYLLQNLDPLWSDTALECSRPKYSRNIAHWVPKPQSLGFYKETEISKFDQTKQWNSNQL